jgi:AraC-like DNA-binding protein
LKILLEQISLVLTNAGIVQGFFVAFLLNSRRVKRSRSNLFLSILLIAMSFSVAHIMYAGKVIHHFTVQVYSVGDPTFLLIAPLLWFYTLELSGHKVRFNISTTLHFLPFLLVIALSLSFRSAGTNDLTLFLAENHRLAIIFFWIVVVVQFSCYQFFIHKKWAGYQVLIQQEVSNTEDASISWLKFFMGVFLLVNVFFLFSLFVVIHFDSRAWLWKAVALTFSLSVFALGYKGILQKEIFHTGNRENAPARLPEPRENKQDQELINRLLAYMGEKKPFLDPELTLSSLAKEMDLSRSQLSQLINEGIGDNFYNFVNQYRVEEVKRLMTDARVKNFNMLGLALEAGFKSKSTFNLIFKRFTGLTPTQYRKNLSE